MEGFYWCVEIFHRQCFQLHLRLHVKLVSKQRVVFLPFNSINSDSYKFQKQNLYLYILLLCNFQAEWNFLKKKTISVGIVITFTLFRSLFYTLLKVVAMMLKVPYSNIKAIHFSVQSVDVFGCPPFLLFVYALVFNVGISWRLICFNIKLSYDQTCFFFIRTRRPYIPSQKT